MKCSPVHDIEKFAIQYWILGDLCASPGRLQQCVDGVQADLRLVLRQLVGRVAHRLNTCSLWSGRVMY